MPNAARLRNNPNSGVEERKWASVFIEIALRAIRRVHHEYGIWGIGRQWIMDKSKTQQMNMGCGIELADERTVCAAIGQEFMNSPSLAGLWTAGVKKEIRYFGIEQEKPYRHKKKKKVDIFVQKYVPTKTDPTKLEKVKDPSYIEAKRARLWKPNRNSGLAKPAGQSQIPSVRQDIRKLLHEKKYRRKGKDSILCHVLVWGIYQKNCKRTDHPKRFFRQLNQPLGRPMLRWLPLEWESTSDTVEPPTVTKFLWVALAEVDPPLTNTSDINITRQDHVNRRD